MKSEIAIFAAGCFWSVEEIYRTIPGVLSTSVGYTGGTLENPKYEDVCTDLTGHAEAVKIEYDPERVSYRDLLRVFFENHNPTTLNKQGPDVGSQYRSAIFCTTQQQQAEAEALKSEMAPKYKDEIVTQIIKAKKFYEAEEYHQKYLHKRGLSACHI